MPVKKVVRHQTNKKIDALVNAGRSDTGKVPEQQLINHLDFLCDISRARIGRTPGLSAKEAAAEAKQQDIWECYAEETR